MLVSNDEAIDQIVRFDRTIGYPHPLRERDSFERLLTALVDACNRFGVIPELLVSACLEASKYCPTDYDLITFASGLKEIKPWKQPAENEPISARQENAIPASSRGSWTREQRREHDAKWAEFCSDIGNRKLANGRE